MLFKIYRIFDTKPTITKVQKTHHIRPDQYQYNTWPKKPLYVPSTAIFLISPFVVICTNVALLPHWDEVVYGRPYRWSGHFRNDERSWRPRLDFPNLMENWYEFHYIFLIHTKFLWYKYLWKLFVKYILIKYNVLLARLLIYDGLYKKVLPFLQWGML